MSLAAKSLVAFAIATVITVALLLLILIFVLSLLYSTAHNKNEHTIYGNLPVMRI